MKKRLLPGRFSNLGAVFVLLVLVLASFNTLQICKHHMARSSQDCISRPPEPGPLAQPWCPNRLAKKGGAAACSGSSSGSPGCVWAQRMPVTPFPQSFWFVKTYKTGGSTLAGVFRSISAHYGIVPVPEWATRPERLNATLLAEGFAAAFNVSDSYAVSIQNHLIFHDKVMLTFDSKKIDSQRLLLFTAVRHPVSRVHSSYVQDACQNTARQLNPTDLEWQWNQCGGPNGGNASTLDLALANDDVEARWEYARAHPKDLNFHVVMGQGSAKTALEVVTRFDFIFVSERMNEALVAFMLEYGLQFEDIAHLSAKNRTGRYKTHRDMPADLNQFIEANNQLDLQLWKLANRKLDTLIRALEQRCGRGVFQAALQTFKALQREVNRECGDYRAWYARLGFREPYSHFGDQGLAPRCLRYVVRRFMAAGGAADARIQQSGV